MDATSPNALKRVSSEFATTAQTICDWMERNKPNAKEGREIRTCLRNALAIDHTADTPQTIAVYGASQAGKSFLTGALTSPESGPLVINFSPEHQLDFLEKINPSGGKESSGLVSRFTITPPATPSEIGPDTPVAVKLLSARDVICILGNTYFRDFKLTTDAPQTSDILAEIKNAIPKEETHKQENPTFTRIDIEALQDYFNASFISEKSYTPFSHGGNANEYWTFLADNISSFSIDTTIKVLSPLWGGMSSPFTEYAQKLLKARLKLDKSELAFCDVTALDNPNNGSILNVETLWGAGASLNATLKSSSGTTVGMGRDVAAALISELILPLQEARWDFQKKNVDLLDFPGARSRGEYPTLDKAVNIIPQLFLRGKVDYLFHLYKANNDLTSVLLCIGDSNQEVTSLPSMIDGWVSTTLGATPEERSTQDDSLYIILTKFDTALERVTGRPDDGTERWDTRLDASIVNYFKNSPWLKAWKPDQLTFNNIQWLRSPSYGSTYERDANGNETTMSPTLAERLSVLKSGYDKSNKVKTYIKNYDKAFDAVLKANDGGVGYLAERLLPLVEQDIKTRKLSLKLQQIIQTLYKVSESFYFDNSQEGNLAEANRAFENFLRSTCIPLNEKGRFGVLLREIAIDSEFITREWITFNKTKPESSSQENDLIASFLSPNTEEESSTSDTAEQKDDYDHFAAHILKRWEEHSQERFSPENTDTQEIRDWLFINNDAFPPFLSQLFKLAERNNLSEEIATLLRNTCQTISKLIQNGTKPGILTAETISNFVTWLGYPPVTEENAPDDRPVFENKQTKRKIFLLPKDPADSLYPDIPDIQARGGSFLPDWLTALKARFKEAGPQYDIEENAKLGKALDNIHNIISRSRETEKGITS